MKQYSRGFAPVAIAIVVGVLILGGAGYFGARNFERPNNYPIAPPEPLCNPVSDPGCHSGCGDPIARMAMGDECNREVMKDWKTYHDEEFGFEMKYPQSWIEQKIYTEKGSGVLFRPAGLEEIQYEVRSDSKDSVSIYFGGDCRNVPWYLGPNGLYLRTTCTSGILDSSISRTAQSEESKILVDAVASTFRFTLPPRENPVRVPISIGDISTWKTYRDSTYKFEFKYPSEFYIRSSNGGAVALASYSIETPLRSPEQHELSLRITLTPAPPLVPGMSLEKSFGLTPWFASVEESYTLEDVQETTFAGESAIIVDREVLKNNARNMPAQTSLRFLHGTMRYQVIYSPSNSALKEVAEQILATFKFTK